MPIPRWWHRVLELVLGRILSFAPQRLLLLSLVLELMLIGIRSALLCSVKADLVTRRWTARLVQSGLLYSYPACLLASSGG